MFKQGTILALCLALTAGLYAVQVKRIVSQSYLDFQKGELRGTSINNEGRLSLGPEIKLIKGPDSEYFLSLDLTDRGDIYVGTGHQAAVYKINPETGATKKVFQSNQLDVYAILAKNNGDIYIGSSPSGKVFKVTPDLKVTTVFDPDEKFIWDLKEDRSGNIICAVGNGGGIYSITKKGDAQQIFAAEDSHIISLAITRNNAILAGSGDRGVLYKIENRKAKVLYDSPLEEIRGICEDGDGNIFFSATKGGFKQKKIEPGGLHRLFDNGNRKESQYVPQKSILYCLRPNGTVETVWSSKEDYIYSIVYDDKENGVIIGTGNTGRIYRVKQNGNFSLIHESESAQVFKLAPGPKGYTMITNNTASVAILKPGFKSQGSYLSEIYDLEVQSQFGKIYWDAVTSAAARVVLFVRAGNSNIADKTWTQWSPPFNDSENSQINLSGYRYLQVKVVLNSSNIGGTPYLQNYRFFYLQTNLRPHVRSIVIRKPKKKTGKPAEKNESPEKDNHILTLQWNAADPNHDQLKYSLFIKKSTDRRWLSVKKNVTETKWSLPTQLYEDGRYVAKVVADDALNNPPSTALNSEMVSEPFLVDSTAPQVNNLLVNKNRVSFVVEDLTSIISRVLCSFDGDLWFPVIPEDKINDSRSERFNFEIKPDSGQRLIFIKVMDTSQNYKVYQREL